MNITYYFLSFTPNSIWSRSASVPADGPISVSVSLSHPQRASGQGRVHWGGGAKWPVNRCQLWETRWSLEILWGWQLSTLQPSGAAWKQETIANTVAW